MRLRRYIVWVPRGYHIKYQYKNTILRKTSKAMTKELNSNTLPSEKKQKIMHKQENEHCPTTGNNDLAHFDPTCNPFQSYLNDMASCLTGMPGESFIHHQQKAINSSVAVSLKNAETFTPDKNHSPACNSSNPSVQKTTLPQRSVSDNDAQKHIFRHAMANNSTPAKKQTQKEFTPNLRRLTGVPECLQASHRKSPQ